MLALSINYLNPDLVLGPSTGRLFSPPLQPVHSPRSGSSTQSPSPSKTMKTSTSTYIKTRHHLLHQSSSSTPISNIFLLHSQFTEKKRVEHVLTVITKTIAISHITKPRCMIQSLQKYSCDTSITYVPYVSVLLDLI